MRNAEKIALLHILRQLRLGRLTLITLGVLVLLAPTAHAAQADGLTVNALVQPDGTLNRKTAANGVNIAVNRIPQGTLTSTGNGPTLVVNTNADTDDGFCDLAGQGQGNLDCTLREAMNTANANSGSDTIHFAADYTINLTSGLPAITDTLFLGNLTIDGETHRIILDGGLVHRIMSASGDLTLELDHLTFRNGYADTSLGYDLSGAAIYSEATTLLVRNSTFQQNNAPKWGGAIFASGDLTVSNSTFSANSAGELGGGVAALSAFELYNNTFSGNSAPGGAAIRSAGTLTLHNTILAHSTGPNCTYTGTLTSAKNNLIDSFAVAACGLSSGVNGNRIGFETYLDSLADNGGVTQTFGLLAFSPALDAGDSATCAVAPVNNADQRGSARPTDGDDNLVAVCDMGAFEARANTGCLDKPAKPTLLKPATNTTVPQPKVSLDWNDIFCTDKFKVSVRNTATGRTAFKKSLTTPATSNIKTGVLPAGTYKWFVKACNAFGCAKSIKFLFTK